MTIPSPERDKVEEIIKTATIQLDTISRTIAHWLEWQEHERASEGLNSGEDTHVMRVPVWPTRGMFGAWIAALNSAVSLLSLSEKRAEEAERLWRCFHCDEVFTDRDAAADHFGVQIEGLADDVACKLTAQEGGIVKMLREAQEELRHYHEEDNAMARTFYALGAEHHTAMQREEEKGYARGIADMKSERAEANAECDKWRTMGLDIAAKAEAVERERDSLRSSLARVVEENKKMRAALQIIGDGIPGPSLFAVDALSALHRSQGE